MTEKKEELYLMQGPLLTYFLLYLDGPVLLLSMDYRGWAEYDLYSSYLLRFWAGAGLQYQSSDWQTLINTRLQIDLGKIQLNYGRQLTEEGWETNTKEAIYQLNDHLALEWLVPNRFGFSLSW